MSDKQSKLLIFLITLAFFIILRQVTMQNIENLPRAVQPAFYASLPVAGGLLILSLASLLGTFSHMLRSSSASDLLRRISEDSMRNFFVGFLATAYLDLVRPALSPHVSFLSYMEWVTIVLTVYVMFSLTKFSSKEYYVTSENLGWKKHVQEIKRETGSELTSTTSVMEQFISQGVKEPLLIYLTFYLQRLGKTEEEAVQALSPLTQYQESMPRHWLPYVLPRKRKQLVLESVKAREDLLNALLDKIVKL